MPLGQGIEELWDAVRDRVEVSGHGPIWHVTAGSFDSALAYARERFDDPAVLERTDRRRWWPRVTLTVTTDVALARSAPPLEDLSTPTVPAQAPPATAELPRSLEAIFAHQEQRRAERA
jgi:hypothetical protein